MNCDDIEEEEEDKKKKKKKEGKLKINEMNNKHGKVPSRHQVKKYVSILVISGLINML